MTVPKDIKALMEVEDKRFLDTVNAVKFPDTPLQKVWKNAAGAALMKGTRKRKERNRGRKDVDAQVISKDGLVT